MLQEHAAHFVAQAEDDFGSLIFTWRGRIKPKDILENLPGWNYDTVRRLEKGKSTPAFLQLRALFRALLLAGVPIPPGGPQTFILRARRVIEKKRTHLDQHSDEEWAELCDDLVRIEREFRIHSPQSFHPNANSLLFLDTSHLVRRDTWHEQMKRHLTGSERKKVIVVPGPSGIGKSSELNRFAMNLRRTNTHRPIFCDFRSAENMLSPDEALHVFMGTVLSAMGFTQATTPPAALEEQVVLLLEQVEKSQLPIVMVLDHAECMLSGLGKLAPSWERLLAVFLKYQHRSTMIIAMKQWSTWFSGESHFLAETPIPTLTCEQSVSLLQQLGLRSVPVEQLRHIYDKVGGIPICLEWVAALVKQPDQGEGEGQNAPALASGNSPSGMLQAVSRLLTESNIFTSALSEEIAPLLERILSHYYLSAEAQVLLRALSISPVPLARTALQQMGNRWEHGVRELRRASLLVAYPDRVQVLPSVAAAVVHSLSPSERYHSEEALQVGLKTWLHEGEFYENEKGHVVTELASLLLSHAHLLAAAEMLIKQSWIAFNLGYAVPLSQEARRAVEQWQANGDNASTCAAQQCGSWLLHYFLYPYLGEEINEVERARDYAHLLDLVIADDVRIEPSTELFVVRHLMFYAMGRERYAEAETLLTACQKRLETHIQVDPELHTAFLEKQGFLFTNWCEYAEEVGDLRLAQTLRERVIAVFQQSIAILENAQLQEPPLKSGILKKRLARALTNMGYHLSRVQRIEEAIGVLQRSIVFKEQGFTEPGSLAASYGDLSQALSGVGRFAEALDYDERALQVIEDLARAGDTVSQETAWIYRVNRGRLYAKIGRHEEARELLMRALPNIPTRWRMYRVFARQALDQLDAAVHVNTQEAEVPVQYDAKWIERYRELISFDSLGMLSPTHFEPCSGEEEEWWQLYSRRSDPVVQKKLEALLAHGKQREVLAAIEEQRDPVLSYPAIELEDVKRRRIGLLALKERVLREEQNAVVRALYAGDHAVQGAIPYHVHLLQLLEATAQGNSDAFWLHGTAIYPVPTVQEVSYALSRVKWFVDRGREQRFTEALSRQIDVFFREQLLLSLNDVPSTEELHAGFQLDVSLYGKPASTTRVLESAPPERVRQLFEALFRDQNCTGWETLVDTAARNTRIEPGQRKYIVAGSVPYSFTKVIELVAHEWGAHIAPRVAGERSPLGILGIGTGRSLATEEGVGYYLEWELAKRTGQRFDEAKIWLGTLATGLAAGVMTPPQTFLPLYKFFEMVFLLYRLIWRGDEEMATARERAASLAQTRCLRTFRGVPPKARAGICFTKDAVYQRGFFDVYSAVQKDPMILDWLATGVFSLDDIPLLRTLGMTPSPHSPRELLERPDLEAYILALEGEA